METDIYFVIVILYTLNITYYKQVIPLKTKTHNQLIKKEFIMTTINNSLIRLSQAFVGIFFIFTISAYFGILLLLPLGILFHFTNLFAGILGINGIVAMLFSIPISIALFYYGYKVDGLYQTISQTGLKLIKLGKIQVLAFEKLLNKSPIHDGKIATSK